MQRPLQTHHLLISSAQPVVELSLPPTLLQKHSQKSSWKVWVSKVIMPSHVPNVSSANNTFVWNGVQYYLWPGKATAQDLCYQFTSTGMVARWSHVDNRFVFQAQGELDLTAANSCAEILGLPRAKLPINGGSGSTVPPRLGLLDYVVVHSSLASNTHVWADGALQTNTQVLCTLPVNDAYTTPYEDLAGDRAVFYHSSLIDTIRLRVTDSTFTNIPTCQEPWHCTISIAEVTDAFEDQLGQLNKNTAELLDLKKISTILKNG